MATVGNRRPRRVVAAQLTAGPRFAVCAIGETVDVGEDASLAAGLTLDRNVLAGVFATEDRRIGIDSFLTAGPGKARFTTSLDPATSPDAISPATI